MSNYPASVTDDDPHFNLPSVQDDVFEPLYVPQVYVPQGGNPFEKARHERRNSPHEPDCRCEECECPY